MKNINKLLTILILLLSHIMVIIVSYQYAKLKFNPYNNSAPATVSFLYAIPFILLIIICLIIFYINKRKNNEK